MCEMATISVYLSLGNVLETIVIDNKMVWSGASELHSVDLLNLYIATRARVVIMCDTLSVLCRILLPYSTYECGF